MKRLLKSIFIFSLLASSSHSAENIRFTRILNTQKNLLELVKENTFQDVIRQEYFCITQIQADNKKINLLFGVFDPMDAGFDWQYECFYLLRFSVDSNTKELVFIDFIYGIGQELQNISLEVPPPPETDPSSSRDKTLLDIVTYDSQQKRIGGLVRWESNYDPGDGHWVFQSYFSLHLWDAKTGKQLFYQLYPHRRTYIDASTSTKIAFSPKDRFLIANEISDATSYKKLFNACLPDTAMLDTQTLQFIPTVKRDVAFTSDERYYCTERNGLPSLVDAQTHEVLFTYKTDTPMTACCFTPDNQKLYIACEDLNIFEFDSHVPLSAVTDWEIYDRCASCN